MSDLPSDGEATQLSDEERAARRERRARRRQRAQQATPAPAARAPAPATGKSGRAPELDAPPLRAGKSKTSARYEFGAAENERFQALAGVMHFAGIASVVLALVGGIFAFPASGSSAWRYALWVFQLVLPVFAGLWTLRAGNAFKAIAVTEGSDIRHLMDAVRELTKLFTLHAIVIVTGMALFVLAMVLVSLEKL